MKFGMDVIRGVTCGEGGSGAVAALRGKMNIINENI